MYMRRDQSACVALQRVAKPGGKEGELQDQWLQFRHLEVGEDEFPLRNKQVRGRHIYFNLLSINTDESFV